MDTIICTVTQGCLDREVVLHDAHLEQFHVPDRGEVDVNVQRSFTINTTAKEAQRTVGQWLLSEVSVLLASDPPDLVIGEQVVWRVPVWIGFPSYGRAGIVGTVNVDVDSGRMVGIGASKAEIEYQANRMAKLVPPYESLHVSGDSLSDTVSVAPQLRVTDEI